MTRILAIDDDPALLRVLKIALGALGYEVIASPTGTKGISDAALEAPDAVVLDLGLPDIDGVEVCRRLRQWTNAPVIVLSADATEDRKVEALDAGADDYITKPFGMKELSARLRVALRHRPSGRRPGEEEDGEAHELDAGPLHLDLVHHEASIESTPVELTRREFAFLAFLTRHQGRVCTHRMILEAVWGPRYANDSRYLREYAYRVRRKLGDEEGVFLRTRPGIGYQLVPPDPATTSQAEGRGGGTGA
jgi:two-component system, OmpR family, KDP operon response regulator KdpE